MFLLICRVVLSGFRLLFLLILNCIVFEIGVFRILSQVKVVDWDVIFVEGIFLKLILNCVVDCFNLVLKLNLSVEM